jgi:hypothetical protein
MKRPPHTAKSEQKLQYSTGSKEMTAEKGITNVLTIALVALGIMGLTAGPVGAASITIANPGFEHGNNGQTPPPHNTQVVDNWDQETGGIYIDNRNDYKPPTDPGPCLYFGAGRALNQDLSYNWSARETFTFGIIGQNPTWSGGTTKFRVELRETDGTVLWDSGELDVTGTVNTGTKLYTGTDHIFSWDIDGSTFVGVPGRAAGSQLNIRLIGVAGSPYLDDLTLSTDLADTTAPTLASSDIVDDKSGGPVNPGELVTYTVTFSETMDDGTVSLSDFDNAGTATVVFGTLTSLGAGVYSIPVVAATTGTLQLRVPTNATLTDLAGNPLDVSSAILDDTTINVVAKPISVTGGDFEGSISFSQDIPEWFDSDGNYADWHQTNTADTSHGSRCALLNKGTGYMYQSLGQLPAGTASLDWSFDQVRLVVKQSQCIGTADLRFFYAVSPDAAQGTDIDTLGLTQIGVTTSIPALDASPSGSDEFRSGSLDVSLVPSGATIWMDFTHTLAVNDRFFLLDNISVTAVIPPGTVIRIR